MSNISNIDRYFNLPSQEKNDLSEMLITGLHESPSEKRNIEFENFLQLEASIERELEKRDNLDDIFTKKIQEVIENHLAPKHQKTFNDILDLRGLSIEDVVRNLKEVYGITEVDSWKRKCYWLALYVLGSKTSLENALFYLADKFNKTYENCKDFPKCTDSQPGKEYIIYNESDEFMYALQMQSLNTEVVLLPGRGVPLHSVFKKQYLLNSNLIQFNKNAIIILLENDIPLAYYQQCIQFFKYRTSLIAQQLEYWSNTKEVYLKAMQKANTKQACDEFPDGKSGFSNYLEKLSEYHNTVAQLSNTLSELKGLNSYIHSPQARYFFNVDKTEKYIWSSFYGNLSELENIPLTLLNNRTIYWLHFGEIDEDKLLLKFLDAYGTLKKQAELQEFSLNINFVYLPRASNTLNLEANGIQFFSPEKLLLRAYEKDVMIPEVLHEELDKYLQKHGQQKRLKFLMENIIGEKSYNLFIAKRGAGKTWISLGIAYALATKHNFAKNWKVKRAARVLYINGEVSDELMQDRCSTFKRMYSKRSGVDKVVVKTMLDLNLVEEKDRVRLEKEIYKPTKNGEPFSLIILDSLLFLAPKGSQEDNWKNEIEPWIRKLKEEGKSIILLHHTNRKSMAFGSIFLENYADCILTLEKSKTNKEKTIQIKIIEERNKRAIEQDPFEIRLSTGKKPKWTPVHPETYLNWKMSTEEKIEKIIELREKDTPVQKIADLFGKHKNTIEKFIQKENLPRLKKTRPKAQ